MKNTMALLRAFLLAGIVLVVVQLGALSSSTLAGMGGNDALANISTGTMTTESLSPSSSGLVSHQHLKKTRIIAACDSLYKDISLSWYRRLSNLGYDTHTILAADPESASLFRQQGLRFEMLFALNEIAGNSTNDNTTTCRSKIFTRGSKHYRRSMFGTRWMHVLRNLQSGYHVLLTDIDNYFVRYLDLDEMESSDFDVFHAYALGFPTGVYNKLGFTVCGGMAWIRSSPVTIRFVETILHRCGWKGASTHRHDANESVTCDDIVICDDQKVINQLLVSPEMNFTWKNNSNLRSLSSPAANSSSHVVENPGFWKESITGKSQWTGHTVKIWDTHTAYRGPISKMNGQCPKNNWVAMPLSGDASDRNERQRKWYELCEAEKLPEINSLIADTLAAVNTSYLKK